MRRLVLGGLVSTLALGGCVASTPKEPVVVQTGDVSSLSSPLKPYPSLDHFLQCVPFARTVSGVDIRGDAWTWWDQAAGRYRRGATPKEGAVLVFKKTPKLKLGHVAVVAQISNPREMLVTHANWGSDGDTRGVVHERQPIIDVSPGNDWSQVRLKNRVGKWGSTYLAHGFIYQPEPATGGNVAVSLSD